MLRCTDYLLPVPPACLIAASSCYVVFYLAMPCYNMLRRGMKALHTQSANAPTNACDLQVPLVPSLSSLGVARQVVLNDQQLAIQPLWIAVHQEENGGAAR